MALKVRRSSSRKVRLIATLIAVFAFVVQPYSGVLSHVASAGSPVFPSTNAQNITNSWANVTQDSAANGSVTLKFSSTRSFASCFEYRADGDTSQKTSSTHYNTEITDGLYPYVCVNNSSQTKTINASGYVEVRQSFGAEKTERFDWTKFNTTAPVPPTCTYDFPAQHMWEVTWGYDFAHRNGGAPIFNMQSNGGLVSLNGGPVPSYMNSTWHWLYVVEGVNRHYDYGFADGTVRTVDVTFNDVNGCQIPTIVWGMSVNTSSTTFVGDPKYVRENNGSDLAAQLVTPDLTQDVRFFVDGDTSSPLSGTNVGGAGATTSWWRLRTPLTAGQHTISAQVKVGGNWYDVADTAIVYSLDAPTAEYVVPSANQYFRPNDLVVRIKADDEFNQFDYMVTTINGVAHTVNRTDCSDKGNYVLCDLKNLNLPDGTYTAKTTTYTKANNRVDNLMSQSFIIDSYAPTIVVNTPASSPTNGYYGKNITIGTIVDEVGSGIDTTKIYAAAPRTDGQCDPNEAKILGPVDATPAIVIPGTSLYFTDVDTSVLNGRYCFFVVAGDKAGNHSNPQIGKFAAEFDNAGPTAPQITTPDDGDYFNASPIYTEWTASTDTGVGLDHYEVEYRYSQGGSPVVVTRTETTNHRDQTLSGSVQGPFTIRVRAFDKLGNASVWSDSVTYTFDSVAPTVSVPVDSGTVAGSSLALNGTVSDDNLDYYKYQILDENKANTLGSIGWSRNGGNSSVTNGLLANVDLTGLGEGTYYIRVWAYDKAGNSTGIASHIYTKFVIDRSGPTVTVDTPTSVRSGEMATLHGTIDDPAATLTVTIDGVTYTGVVRSGNNWSLSVDTTSLTTGNHPVVVSSADVYNNHGADQTTTLVIASPVTSPLPHSIVPGRGGLIAPGVKTSGTNGTGAPNTTPSTANDDTAVLGTKDDSGKAPADTTASVVKPSEQGWKVLGLAWYWWLLILAALAAAWWWFAAARRHAEETT